MSFLRFTKKPLPSYAFIPGKAPHPLKSPDGHMYDEGEPEVEPLNRESWEESTPYLYSLDLLNAGYFWESHVWLEALWNAHDRRGPEAELFKGLIKIGAAGIKARMGSLSPAQGHLKRASELFQKAFEELSQQTSEESPQLLGFSQRELQKTLDQTLEQLPDFVNDPHRTHRTFSPLAPLFP